MLFKDGLLKKKKSVDMNGNKLFVSGVKRLESHTMLFCKLTAASA